MGEDAGVSGIGEKDSEEGEAGHEMRTEGRGDFGQSQQGSLQI